MLINKRFVRKQIANNKVEKREEVMKRTVVKILSVILTVNMLMFTAGCISGGDSTGKDNNHAQANVVSNSANTVNNGSGSSQNDPVSGNSGETVSYETEFPAGSLAERFEGTYFGKDEGDEPFILSIYNFYGNLYAYGGYTESEEDPDVYSFWVMEIVPENPEELYDENLEELRVGVQAFSIMSNLGRYWSAPVTGRMGLTKDGIIVTGDGDLCPLSTNGKTISLKRRDDIKGFFDDDSIIEALGNSNPSNDDESLYGIWKEKGSDAPMYISFEKGDEYPEACIYSKVRGMEADVEKGFFDVAGNKGRMVTKYMISGSPETHEFSYTISGDSLTFDEGFGEGKEFERAGINDIPVAGLVKPDNVDAIKGTLRLEKGDISREVYPSFEKIAEVENNGTDFVRVGNLIFFRYYDEKMIDEEPVYASLGEFKEHYDLDKAGCVCYYDLRTGETGLAYRDECAGDLYYMDGKFYSERFEANDYYSVSYLMAANPDGSALEAVSDTDTFSTVAAISDNNDCLAVDQFLAGQLYLDYGNMYKSELILKENNSVMAVEFEDDYVYVATIGDNDDKIRLTEYRKHSGGEGILLAEYEGGNLWAESHPRVYEILVFEEEVYLGVNWFKGVEDELRDCVLIKAERNKENSGEVIYEGLPEGLNVYSRPYFFLNYADEIYYTDRDVNGEIGLSEWNEGDLGHYAPFSAIIIKEDFIEENPYAVYDGMSTTIFQEGEAVGSKYFIVTANATYVQSQDIGGVRMYELNELNYMIFDSNGNETVLKPVF